MSVNPLSSAPGRGRSAAAGRPGLALTLRAGFYTLVDWVAARSELFRLAYGQAAARAAMGRRVTVLRVSDGFSGFLTIPVALSRHGCRVLATVVALGVAGCASVAPATPEARQTVVQERSQARWDALIKGDVVAAYGYLSPASRQVFSLERFKVAVGRGTFRKVAIDSVSCVAETCEVKYLLTYDHRQMKGITTVATETWVWSDGQAWFFLRE